MISLPTKTAYNAFGPYVRAANIPMIDEEPIRHNGVLYYEVAGSDCWLAQSLLNCNGFYVSDSNGNKLSDVYYNPAYAVERLKELLVLESKGWLYV